MKGRPELIDVRLECGCLVRLRDAPWETKLLMCTSGLGHGYRQRWTEYIERGKVRQNWRLLREVPRQRTGARATR